MKKILSLFLVIIGLGSLALVLLQFRFFIVQSGSMEPAVPTQSIVVTAKQQSRFASPVTVAAFNSGEIISFQLGREIFTHRVVGVEASEGNIAYKTKGDANGSLDREIITQNLVLGKVVLVIPHLGKLFSFAQTRNGHVIFVVIPATIIIYRELAKIYETIHTRA